MANVCFGKFMRLGVVKSRLLDFKNINGKTELIGLEANMWNLLSEKLNLNYTIIQVPYFGSYIPENNTWTGIVGKLHNQEIDAALADLSITTSRMSVIDFSDSYFTDLVSFSVKLNTNQFVETFDQYFLKSFSTSVWSTVFAATVLYATILKVFVSFPSCDKYVKVQPVMYIVGLLLNDAQKIKVRKRFPFNLTLFILLAAWSLSCISLIVAYSSKLTATTSYSKHEGIKTLDQLFKLLMEEKLRLGVQLNTVYYDFLIENTSLMGYLLRNSMKVLSQTENFAKQMTAGEITFLAPAKHLYLYMKSRGLEKEYYTIREPLFHENIALGFVKNYNCTSRINRMINKIKECGFLRLWEKDLMRGYQLQEEIQRDIEPDSDLIMMKDLKSLFRLWLYGLFFSSGGLLCERYVISFVVTSYRILKKSWWKFRSSKKNNFTQFFDDSYGSKKIPGTLNVFKKTIGNK